MPSTTAPSSGFWPTGTVAATVRCSVSMRVTEAAWPLLTHRVCPSWAVQEAPAPAVSRSVTFAVRASMRTTCPSVRATHKPPVTGAMPAGWPPTVHHGAPVGAGVDPGHRAVGVVGHPRRPAGEGHVVRRCPDLDGRQHRAGLRVDPGHVVGSVVLHPDRAAADRDAAGFAAHLDGATRPAGGPVDPLQGAVAVVAHPDPVSGLLDPAGLDAEGDPGRDVRRVGRCGRCAGPGTLLLRPVRARSAAAGQLRHEDQGQQGGERDGRAHPGKIVHA